MARTKEFDPETALDRALDLFWTHGYESTSMADLVGHLGIARASIYATFGSKHELYLRALERYVRTTNASLVELLSRPGPVLPAIRALLVLYASQEEPRRGCMVVNAACELLPADPLVGREVVGSWDMLESALASALSRARAQGEIAEERDPHALARFLLVVLQGLRVTGKGYPRPTRLDDAIEQTVAALA